MTLEKEDGRTKNQVSESGSLVGNTKRSLGVRVFHLLRDFDGGIIQDIRRLIKAIKNQRKIS
jgi:hypothetical protein